MALFVSRMGIQCYRVENNYFAQNNASKGFAISISKASLSILKSYFQANAASGIQNQLIHGGSVYITKLTKGMTEHYSRIYSIRQHH